MTEVKRKRKIPVECDTMLWDGSLESAQDIFAWMLKYGNNGGVWTHDRVARTKTLKVPTLEGPVITGPGSLIVKGVDDEFWPVADGIWQRTYEDVPESKLTRSGFERSMEETLKDLQAMEREGQTNEVRGPADKHAVRLDGRASA